MKYNFQTHQLIKTLILVLVPILVITIIFITVFGHHLTENIYARLEIANGKIQTRFDQLNEQMDIITQRVIFSESVQHSLREQSTRFLINQQINLIYQECKMIKDIQLHLSNNHLKFKKL